MLKMTEIEKSIYRHRVSTSWIVTGESRRHFLNETGQDFKDL